MKKIETMIADHLTFGVELETIIPTDSNINVGGYHRGAPVLGGPEFQGLCWTAQRDGSIHRQPGYQACEFVSPILQGAEGIQNLINMVAYINRIGGKVNRSTGLHIHIGLNSLFGIETSPAEITRYLDRLASVVNINTKAIYAQTGTRRDQNIYCAPLTEMDHSTLRNRRNTGDLCLFSCDSRYKILNLTNLTSSRKRTIEFRAFAGTLNIEKILHHLWTVFFLCRFAQELETVPWKGRGWKSEEGGDGEKALRGLHHKMRKHCLVGAMKDHVRGMRKIALDMAVKFDQVSA